MNYSKMFVINVKVIRKKSKPVKEYNPIILKTRVNTSIENLFSPVVQWVLSKHYIPIQKLVRLYYTTLQ